MPMSTASRADSYAKSVILSSIADSLSFDLMDEVVHDGLQRHDRWQVHDQGYEAVNVAILDGEIDVQEQHQISACAIGLDPEQHVAVASNDGGERHSHGAMQHVRDRRQA